MYLLPFSPRSPEVACKKNKTFDVIMGKRRLERRCWRISVGNRSGQQDLLAFRLEEDVGFKVISPPGRLQYLNIRDNKDRQKQRIAGVSGGGEKTKRGSGFLSA